MDIWMLAGVIAVLSLDTTAVGQFMVSRPIVVGPVIGLLTGDVVLGLGIGALIELIWIGQLPVGNNLPLDATLLTGLTVALADHFCDQSGGRIPKETLFTFALAVSIPLAVLSSEAEQALRKFHRFWVHRAQSWIEGRRFFLADTVNTVVILELFLKAFLMAALGLWLLYALTPWFLYSPEKILHGFAYAHWFLMALGCAAAVDLLVERRTFAYLVLPAVLAAALAYFLKMEAFHLMLVALLAGFLICALDFRKTAVRTVDDRPTAPSPPAVALWALAGTFIRSFFLQAVWNFERGLNYGVTYALAPVLKHLFQDEERSRSLVRHMDYFNTQPYFASFILGATVRMEAERAQLPETQQKQKAEEISALKMGMMGPVAALGDQLFWATIRPYCGLIAVTLVFTGNFNDPLQHLLVPALFLLIYNAAHLTVRGTGFIQGFRLGDQIVHAMKRHGFQEAVRCLRLASAVLLGALLVCMNYHETQKGLTLFAMKMVFFSGILGLYTYFLHKRVNVAFLFYSVVLFALILAYWPDLSAPSPFTAGGLP